MKKRLAERGSASKGDQKARFTLEKTLKRISKVIAAEREDIWQESAEGDVSREMIPTQ